MAFKLPLIHPFLVAFADALESKSNKLHNVFLRYNGKMAVCTAKFAKRVEMIKMFYRFDDSNSITGISFWNNSREVGASMDYPKF